MDNVTVAQEAPSLTGSGEAKSGTFGLVPVANAKAVFESDRAQAESANNQPVIMGLAGHVKRCFDAAKTEKSNVEQRMLSSLRARRGEYDPETLARIKATNGSEVFMMLSSAKARAATALLRDALMGSGLDKPWTIDPTKEPEIPQDMVDDAILKAGELVQMLQDTLGGPQMVSEAQVEDILELARSRSKVEVRNFAKAGMLKMESKMEDQMQEGGFSRALYEFSDDISTFPAAIIKGPVVRKRPKLAWEKDATGAFQPVVSEELLLEWERVSPFNLYPAPGARDINDGYLIELHNLRPSDLESMKGVEGYSSESITQVIDAHGQGGLKEWTAIASAVALAEGRNSSSISDTTAPLIDALQFWGPVLGKDLLDFGMEASKVTDPTKTYHCEVWLIGTWVIKAVLNYDPLGRKPYYKASWEEIPGAFWGNSPIDLIKDCQILCNNAARALANNMAISSGPQVDVNMDRIAPGEVVTSMYPWKVWQTRSDPFGSNTPPVNFFQPQSNAAELMGIYEKFADIADNVSGIPRYMTGDAVAGGAGRTASGLSMMLGNAGKSLKSVIACIDTNVLTLAIERLFYYNMKHSKDPDLKRTDVKVVARGAAGLLVKELAQVRRNEFLNIVLSNEAVMALIGEEAVASLLRSMAQGLDMDVDKIIPPAEVIKARLFARQHEMAQQKMSEQQAAAAGQETGSAPGEAAPAQGPRVMPDMSGDTLPGGQGQVTNSFAESRT